MEEFVGGIVLMCTFSFLFILPVLLLSVPDIKDDHRRHQNKLKEIKRRTGFTDQMDVRHAYRVGEIDRDEHDYWISMFRGKR